MRSKVKYLEKSARQWVLNQIQRRELFEVSEKQVRRWTHEFLTQRVEVCPQKWKNEMIEKVTYSIVGLGPLEPLLRDDAVSEIMVNGPDHIFVEKEGVLQKTSLKFLDDRQVLNVINQIVGKMGRRIDESTPMVDARLEDGSRVNAIIPPLALNGATLTIRKFPKKVFGISDMKAKGSLTSEMADFLEQAVKQKQNILISGGTGAGKTSTLNACASMIPEGERIITIEDAAEMRIKHPHLIALESRPSNLEGRGDISIRQLLKNALRMRPDRIVVGEIRGGEAIDMLQAMNTGHKGSLTTVHANAPLESLYRVETMVLMGDIGLPVSAIRPQVIQGIDIIVQQMRLSDGTRKVMKISEVGKSLESSEYQVHDIFFFDEPQKTFKRTNYTPQFLA